MGVYSMGVDRSGVDPTAKFLPPSQLPKKRQQVAAVCYRAGKRGIEFLLVQTRGRRWIFPKGGVEFGLTHAQSAALEAFEEAGVHGRMEKVPFSRYLRRLPQAAAAKKNTRQTARASQHELAVTAHLCEVTRLEPPQESNRKPTWFSPEKAKQRLLEDREPEFGAELAAVVDRALKRIQRLHSSARHTCDGTYRDGLQEVRFEALEHGRLHDHLRDAALRHFFRQRSDARAVATEATAPARFRRVFQVGATEESRPALRLGTGSASPTESVRNITAIDSGRKANPARTRARR